MGWTATAPQVIAPAIHRALTAVGLHLQGDARTRAPRDTGRLIGSITFATQREVSQTGPNARAGDAVSRPSDPETLHVGTNVEYAAYQEYGTHKQGGAGSEVLLTRMAAQPYLRPALDNNRREVREIFADYLRRGLNGK